MRNLWTQLREKAEKLGATVSDEGCSIIVDAPEGSLFAATNCSVIVQHYAEPDEPQWRLDAIKEAIVDLDAGLVTD